jgi:Rieske Fe-S protein
MTDLSRREALFVAGAVAGACACCALSPDTAQAAEKAGPKPKSLPVGKLADYPKPGFYDKFAAQKLLIARLDDRLVAISTICTHKGCSVKKKPGEELALKCPCHKAEFSAYGTPTGGPAKTALDRYAITQGADGTLIVDMTKAFIESKWEDPAAFVPIKAG